VVNILTGKRAGTHSHIATHMDVNAIVDGTGDASVRNCKRVWQRI
jgi:hypothetical protein